MTTINLNNCNERIKYSIVVLILYIIFSAVIRIDVTIAMVITYSFLQLLLSLKQKIKPMPITIFNIIVSTIFVICILPTFMFLFNQTFILKWEHYIIIIITIYSVIDQFKSIKSNPYVYLPYACLIALTNCI